MYRENKLETYLAEAAAGQPAPGGGSVSALAGALAAAMGEMVGNFTVGKEKFAGVEQEVQAALDSLGEAREKLLQLMQRDVEAYTAVNRAYSMPRQSDEQKAARDEAVGNALRGAMDVPLRVMRQCAAVGVHSVTMARSGNPNLITDAGVSAILAEAACAAAALNVGINLKFLDDADLAAQTRGEMDRLTRQVEKARQEVGRLVAEQLQ